MPEVTRSPWYPRLTWCLPAAAMLAACGGEDQDSAKAYDISPSGEWQLLAVRLPDTSVVTPDSDYIVHFSSVSGDICRFR